MDKVLMTPPGGGEPVLVEASPEVLIPMQVQGWTQTTTAPVAPAEEDEQ